MDNIRGVYHVCLCLPFFQGKIVCILTCENGFFNMDPFSLFSPFNPKFFIFYMWSPILLALRESLTFSLHAFVFFIWESHLSPPQYKHIKLIFEHVKPLSLTFSLSVSVCEREREEKKKQRLIINEGGSSAWQSGTETTLSFSFAFLLRFPTFSLFLHIFLILIFPT